MNGSNEKEAVAAVPVPEVFHFWSPPWGRIILLKHHLESVILLKIYWELQSFGNQIRTNACRVYVSSPLFPVV